MDDLGLDLDLDLPGLIGPGRKAADLRAEVVRPLRASDLAFLATNRETAPLSLKRLSDRHHGLARLIAAGTPPGEAAVIMRYDNARVSVLQGDPAFKELIEFYRAKVDDAFDVTVEHMAGLTRDAILELRDRLEEAPDVFTNKELRELAATFADRSGHGPTSKQETNININLGERLEVARKRALAARLDLARDITPSVAAE